MIRLFVLVFAVVVMVISSPMCYGNEIFEIDAGTTKKVSIPLPEKIFKREDRKIRDDMEILYKGHYTFTNPDQEDEMPIHLDLLVQKKITAGKWETIHSSKLTRFKPIKEKRIELERERRIPSAQEEELNKETTESVCGQYGCNCSGKINTIMHCYKDKYRILIINLNQNSVDVKVMIHCTFNQNNQ